MATIVTTRNDNITASTKTSNLLANTDLAFATDNGTLYIYGVSSAAGVNIEAGVQNDKLITDREIIYIGTSIDKSAHLIGSFDVAAGASLSCFLRETAGVATTDILLSFDLIPFTEQ